MYDSAERAPDGLPASPERLSRRDETADASSHARTNSSASSSLSLSRLSLLKQKSRKFSFHSQQQSTGSEGKDKRAPGARTHRSASSPLANDELQQQQQHKGQGVSLSRLQSLALRSFKPRPRRDSQLATVDSDP
ncbi:hypothetical protein EV182_005997 [Spiromyces aspiralis]|uniref:Uncharacterized protein n=1 Tax=Spiromyces aspiralis TaxID=68401 RepID=A0ACC1HPC1_9FUNG|nr:hypothetical protein EV182_005997 [Spiromyces aspiralis]